MFPSRSRSSRGDASNNYNRRNDRGSWNNNSRQENYDRRNRDYRGGGGAYESRRRRTPPWQPSRGYGMERRETLEEMRQRQINNHNAERAEALERRVQELEQEKERDMEAQSQRFGAHGDSSSSDCAGGAPIMIKKKKNDKKKKRRRGQSTDSNSSSASRSSQKKIKYSDDDEPNPYEFLTSTKAEHPIVYTHTAPEKRELPRVEFDHRRKKRKIKAYLDPKKLKTEFIEYLFPPKEPTLIDDGVYRIEEVPYDTINSASVGVREEPDWERIPFEHFQAMSIIEQNVFAQSSASKKVSVYKFRLEKATEKKEKIECWVNLVNLEEARVAESRKNEKLTGKWDITAVKLEKIKAGIQDCGENVELRLLELDILTASKGEHSEEVKNAWNNLMNRFPNDLTMWRRRLTYYRNKRAVFNAPSYIKDSVLPCLSKLGGILIGTFKSHQKQEGTEEFIIDVIVAAASFYIEMGAMHKAIGILQALVEFHFLVPQMVKDNFDFKKKLSAFECYWRTPIPKAGHSGATGWNKQSANNSYTKYDFERNILLTAEKETKQFNDLCKKVFEANIKFCKDDKLLSTCERWSKIECSRTGNLWEPLYNSESKPLFGKRYNWYADISPYLIQLPKDIIEKAIFKILTKLGAVFPDVKNFSQEAVFQQCHVGVVDENFKMEYVGMKKFVDNILYLISGANEEMFVYATIARMMTVKAFAINSKNRNDPVEQQLKEATKIFLEEVRKLFESVELIRRMNEPERHIMNSYASQLVREIAFYYLQDPTSPMGTSGDRSSILAGIKDIFAPEIMAVPLLSSIRFYVMVCRELPYYADEAAEHDVLTKLKFLMKVSFPNEDVNYEDKDAQEKAIQKWKNVKLHENAFNLPTGSRWIGDINAFALELFSTLCYEVEDAEPDEADEKFRSKKFPAFAEHYTQEILEHNEDLTEMYFKTWNRHVNYYCEEKKAFLEKLRTFMDIFPRNQTLTLMYVATIQRNEIETRTFFLLNQHEDDIVKVLRCIVQLSAEFENILSQESSVNNNKGNNRYYLEILKNSAELSLTNIIPESHLWRSALFFIKLSKNTEFNNTFLIANDQCPWSKLLLMHAASLSTNPQFIENIEAHASKAGISLLTTLDEVKEMNY